MKHAFLLAAALALSASATHAADSTSNWYQRLGVDVVKGSGNVQTEKRAVAPFEAIVLADSMTVAVRQTGREVVEVRADDNLLPLIETRVVDRVGVPTLQISLKKGAGYSTRTHVVVHVEVARLSGLTVSGSGDLEADGLQSAALKVSVSGSGDVKLRQVVADDLSLRISGSGDIHAEGRSTKLGIAIAGSGDVDSRALEADEVKINIAGSGDASVAARKALSISIAGSGDVTYTGDAVPKTSVVGSGTVTRR